ncbi:Hin recombinase [Enterobacter mori]|nr:Hin recombinase [Enterobacter mori]HCM9655480.1 Hin recombinase [Enterobacter kobei]
MFCVIQDVSDSGPAISCQAHKNRPVHLPKAASHRSDIRKNNDKGLHAPPQSAHVLSQRLPDYPPPHSALANREYSLQSRPVPPLLLSAKAGGRLPGGDHLLAHTHSGIVRAKASGNRFSGPPVLSEQQKQAVAERIDAGISISAIAREFNTTRQTILRVKAGHQQS